MRAIPNSDNPSAIVTVSAALLSLLLLFSCARPAFADDDGDNDDNDFESSTTQSTNGLPGADAAPASAIATVAALAAGVAISIVTPEGR